MLISSGPILKRSNVLTWRERHNLDRPLDPNFTCKMRRAGVFYSCCTMLLLEVLQTLQLVLNLTRWGIRKFLLSLWRTDGSITSICIHIASFHLSLISHWLNRDLNRIGLKRMNYPRKSSIPSLSSKLHLSVLHLSFKSLPWLFLSTSFLAFRLYKAWSTTPEGSRSTCVWVEEPSCTCRTQGSFLFLVDTLASEVLKSLKWGYKFNTLLAEIGCNHYGLSECFLFWL